MSSGSKIGTCKLCDAKDVELRKSHIIPELFYTRVYTKDHNFAAMSKDAGDGLDFQQKGYRERLLCQLCESKLSVWEGQLKIFTDNVISDSYTRYQCARLGRVTLVAGIDYEKVKLAVLSIFWRMGISSIELFSGYCLGPYQEKFRKFLNSSQVPAEANFPVVFSRASLDGKFLPGILLPVGRGRYAGRLIMQSVVLNGVVVDCLMASEKQIPSEFSMFSLSQCGRALITERTYDELGLDLWDFTQRVKMDDVRKFYEKHA